MTRDSFTFEGETVTAGAGSSVAAALIDAGHRHFRTSEKNAPRSIFCGMGVCQDCLVTIDGKPNQSACMTKIRPGMTVTRQPARPALSPPPQTSVDAQRHTPDVLIIGGGAGGLNAAIAAREKGADVLLLDERQVAGGQYFKQQADAAAPPLDRQQSDGEKLLHTALKAGVTILSGAEVWGAFDGPQILASDSTTAYLIRPRALVVATGAYERPAMIDGWTLPGVMTTGAAQTLWRSYRTLPGKRVAIFGNGPLNAQVALELARGGAKITLLGEAAPSPFSRPATALSLLAAGPGLSLKGGRMLAQLRRYGVRQRYATVPLGILEDPDGLRVAYRENATPRETVVDAVCMNFGFQPQNEILRLLGARMTYDRAFDQLRPERCERCETSVPGVYAVGDCCGLGGAPAAAIEGRIAGCAAAGRQPDPSLGRDLRTERRFQRALWALHACERLGIEEAGPDTLVCRCEEITRQALDEALETGLTDIGSAKRATRIGMGRCQGRYCAPAVAAYLARKYGKDPTDLSYFAPRVPIKPVDIGTIVAAETLLEGQPADE